MAKQKKGRTVQKSKSSWVKKAIGAGIIVLILGMAFAFITKNTPNTGTNTRLQFDLLQDGKPTGRFAFGTGFLANIGGEKQACIIEHNHNAILRDGGNTAEIMVGKETIISKAEFATKKFAYYGSEITSDKIACTPVETSLPAWEIDVKNKMQVGDNIVVISDTGVKITSQINDCSSTYTPLRAPEQKGIICTFPYSDTKGMLKDGDSGRPVIVNGKVAGIVSSGSPADNVIIVSPLVGP